MKIYNVVESGRGEGQYGPWTKVSFTDETGQKYSSFDEWLLNLADGTEVDGDITIKTVKGVQYHNFKADKHSDRNIQLVSQDTPIKPPIAPTAPKPSQPDWDAIAEGKVRHGLVVAMIENGWEWNRIIEELPKYVTLVMKGGDDSLNEVLDEIPF